MPSEQEKWFSRLDELKWKQRLRTDGALAQVLGISAAMLAHTRTGRGPLPLRAKVVLLDLLGYRMTKQNVLEFLPEEIRDLIAVIDARRSGASKPEKN